MTTRFVLKIVNVSGKLQSDMEGNPECVAQDRINGTAEGL